MIPRNIPASDYQYELPACRIAAYPLEKREQSRLLVSRGEEISEASFSEISAHLPAESLVVFNDTRVVQARLHFQKASGSRIEVFLLEPAGKHKDIQMAFEQQERAEWKCLVGQSRRWKSGLLEMPFKSGRIAGMLYAGRIAQEKAHSLIDFRWTPAGLSFAQVLEACGKVPLPPYIPREAEEEDKVRYQTVYADNEGSVAAPTAGLHFTPELMHSLEKDGHQTGRLTLHVGAGTFRPLSTPTIGGHEMHQEQIRVHIDLIRQLAAHPGSVSAVGTTSVRTLETLYWLGAKHLKRQNDMHHLSQWEAYEMRHQPSREEALSALTDYMEEKDTRILQASTQLIIVPGYSFKVTDAMITNFHQPGSTLLMLVAAFTGQNWRIAYDYALRNGFRFLSYGDACLFLKT
jgi:S-adenosylmethionine:tRNA ribosyltransferase-isomerase